MHKLEPMGSTWSARAVCLGDLTKPVLETGLEVEMDEHVGHE